MEEIDFARENIAVQEKKDDDVKGPNLQLKRIQLYHLILLEELKGTLFMIHGQGGMGCGAGVAVGHGARLVF